jgi:hypothetical protein
MHVLRRNPWLPGLGVLLAVLVVYGARASADVTTDQPGSIIIFPKVISNGTLDTTIQITNTDTMAWQAQCYYVHSIGCPTGETCCEDDFVLTFTKQQPLGWLFSVGGYNAITQEIIPGRGTATAGELKCVVLGPDGVPIPANVLKGEATIASVAGGTASVYNAIAIQATSPLSSGTGPDFALPLNGTQYNACPASLLMNFRPDGSYDPLTDATITNEVTLVPCTEDITETVRFGGTPSRARFAIVNEFENLYTGPYSAFQTFDCWFNGTLGAIDTVFTYGFLGTEFATATITPPPTSVCVTGDPDVIGQPCDSDSDCTGAGMLACRPWTGLLGVAEQIHTSAAGTSREAYNLHVNGTRPGDIIIAPIGPID